MSDETSSLATSAENVSEGIAADTASSAAQAVVSTAGSIDWGGFIISLFTSGLVGKLVSLGVLVITEVFEAKKRAREKEEKFELDLKTFNDLVSLAQAKMLSDASSEYREAQDVEDRMNNTPIKPLNPASSGAEEKPLSPQ